MGGSPPIAFMTSRFLNGDCFGIFCEEFEIENEELKIVLYEYVLRYIITIVR